ncbi:PP2C family protein-serine/threonine phosphatase [Streptomyces sp. ST2-7A]|uniref:PP2C family protein-serine/threonine phosphatase n=1 Tax=Streptomyces sp. ST2-7A TaxID=2907214 RepID=UPI001F4925F6|nr:GAF domain-containing SpoIIE family protein phosphatase [Streptomyces sp. ST2-7A]MCE7081322.1 SpoIIE family protein phosphatase [Streptomyces sp. ST2-7A]
MDAYDLDDVLQRALSRLALIAEVTTALGSTLDAAKGLRRVCRILVPQLADWCAVDLIEDVERDDGGHHLHRVVVVHHDPPTLPPDLPTGRLPRHPRGAGGPAVRVLRGAGPLLITDPPEPTDPPAADSPELLGRVPATSAVVAPLRARRRVLGVLTLARTAEREQPFDTDHLELVDDLCHRIALAVDNARLHREVRHTAEQFQRALLPDLSRVGHLELAARYVPARTEAAEVGGDWYDGFLLPTGDTALIIGDVTGHDMRAAVEMSQLRNMLRGIACDRQEPPGKIIGRLDLAHHTVSRTTATCLYAVLRHPEDGVWELNHSSAGHLPMLLVGPEGDTHYLEGGRGMMLGVSPGVNRPSAVDRLPARSTLVLYTDGLIERRGESIDLGLTRLRQHAAALAREPLPVFCDELLAGLLADHHPDDVALLALRLPAVRDVR